MRVFVMTDLEGVAGVASFERDVYPGAPRLDRARALLTAEVNAAVAGLIAAGADEVTVMDGHGDGAVLFEDLDPRASLIHGRPWSLRWVDELAGCAAAIFVGQHAMAGTPDGNLNHTQDSRTTAWITLNGETIGEIGQFALLAGARGVSAIFLSGDEAACREFTALVPGAVTAAVKRGLGRNSAVSVSTAEARRRIREGARAALEGHRRQPVAPLTRRPPYVLERRFFTTASVEPYTGRPGVEIVDDLTIRVRGDDLGAIIFT
jgi:D-amino peptidase